MATCSIDLYKDTINEADCAILIWQNSLIKNEVACLFMEKGLVKDIDDINFNTIVTLRDMTCVSTKVLEEQAEATIMAMKIKKILKL